MSVPSSWASTVRAVVRVAAEAGMVPCSAASVSAAHVNLWSGQAAALTRPGGARAYLDELIAGTESAPRRSATGHD